MWKDDIDSENISLRSYLFNVFKKLKEFIGKCDEWFIVFNNKFKGVESEV